MMTLTDEQRKRLTEYLGEPEATSEYTVANNGDLVSVKTVIKNRTFDNRDDLMDLYEQVEKDERWGKFIIYSYEIFSSGHLSSVSEGDYISWLFCLSGEGYEDRCKMVSEFYGWKEADHD
jgi:hypothetical protein